MLQLVYTDSQHDCAFDERSLDYNLVAWHGGTALFCHDRVGVQVLVAASHRSLSITLLRPHFDPVLLTRPCAFPTASNDEIGRCLAELCGDAQALIDRV